MYASASVLMGNLSRMNLGLVVSLLLGYAHAETPDSLKVQKLESRRMSIYAYSFNAFLNYTQISCDSCDSRDNTTCKSAFDGDSFNTSNKWVPSVPSVNVTLKGMREVFSGRVLLDSGTCYKDKRVKIGLSDQTTQEVVMVTDPFSTISQNWLRFDLNTTNTTFVNLIFPNCGKNVGFVEIEMHATGRMIDMLRVPSPANCTRTDVMTTRNDINGTFVFVRIFLVSACENLNESINITIVINGVNQMHHNQTYHVGEMNQGQMSQGYVIEIDRQDVGEVIISHPANTGIIMDYAALNDTAQLLQWNCSDCDNNNNDKCDQTKKMLGGHLTTYWDIAPNKNVTVVLRFNDTYSITTIRINQTNIEKITYKSCSANTYIEISTLDITEANSTGWVTVQENFTSNAVKIIFNALPKKSNGEAKVFEIEVYGKLVDSPTTTPPTSTLSITRSTTTSPATPTTTTSSTTPPMTTSSTTPPTTTSSTTPPTTTSSTTSTTTSLITLTTTTSSTVPSTVSLTQSSTKSSTTTSTTTGATTSATSSSTSSTTTSMATMSNTGKVTEETNRLTDTTSSATVTMETTSPLVNKTSYTVTMKILDVTFEPGMADNTSDIYSKTCQKYVPLVEDAIVMTVGDAFLPPVHNIWYKNGSIDMTYTFDVRENTQVSEDLLSKNLRNVFNASGINLGPIDLHDPPEESKLLLAALVGALTCLVVVTITAIAVICARRRCRHDDRSSVDSYKNDDYQPPSTVGPNVSGTIYPYGRTERVWQRGESMTNSQWQNSPVLAAAPLDIPRPRGLAHLRSAVVSTVSSDGAFSYPEPRQLRGVNCGHFVPNGMENMDYFTDPVISTGFDQPRLHRRQLTNPSGIASYTNPGLSDSDIELDNIDPALVASASFEDDDDDLISDLSVTEETPTSHQYQRQDSADTQITTSFALPKFYRDQDSETTYKGFFETNANDAFAIPAVNALRARFQPRESHDLQIDDSVDRTARCVDSSPDSSSDISIVTLSDISEHRANGCQYDSGYDDALKIYYADPKLDDRNFIQRISETFGRGWRNDIIHREPPVYLKPDRRNMENSTKVKSQDNRARVLSGSAEGEFIQ